MEPSTCERVENKLEQVQHILGEIVNRLPVANESDLDPLRAEIAGLTEDATPVDNEADTVVTEPANTGTDNASGDATVPNTDVPEPNSVTQVEPVSTEIPTDTRSEILSFLDSATQDELSALEQYIVTNWPASAAKTA